MSDTSLSTQITTTGVEAVHDAVMYDILVNIAGGMTITEACQSKNISKKRFDLWIARHPEAGTEVAAFIRSKTFERLEDVAKACDDVLISLLQDAENPELLNVGQKMRLHTHLTGYLQRYGDPKFLSTPGKERSKNPAFNEPESLVPNTEDDHQGRNQSSAAEFLRQLQPRLKSGKVEITERKITIEKE